MGAPQIAKIALIALSTALTMSRRIEGPRLTDLKVTTADFGTPIRRLFGTRRLDGCPCIWAEDLKEHKSTDKTKGGKYDNYSYTGSWAVIITDRPISAMRRIWMDNHLVYQAKDAGPIHPFLGMLRGSGDGAVKLSLGHNLRVYLGSDTQMPDPRIESWCEDRYGADTCPAYRGRSYVVFEDIPLDNFGNRVPTVTVEAVDTASPHYLWESFATNVGGPTVISPDYSTLIADTEVWDIPTRTRLTTLDFSPTAIDPDGVLWDVIGYPGTLTAHSRDGAPGGSWSLPYAGGGADAVGGMVLIRSYANLISVIQYWAGDHVEALLADFAPSCHFADDNGDAWAAGWAFGEAKVYFHRLRDHHQFFVNTVDTYPYINAMDNGRGQFVLGHGSHRYLIDKAGGSIVTTVDAGSVQGWVSQPRAGDYTLWLASASGGQFYKMDTATLAITDTRTGNSWKSEGISSAIYDPINNAFICRASYPANLLTWRYLDRITNGAVTLGDVVTTVCGWAGITSVDASALAQSLDGWSVMPQSAKDMISPLLDIHDSSCRPHDFGLQFLPRGGTAGATIDVADFAVDGKAPRYKTQIEQDPALPKSITINFSDMNHDEQANNVRAERPFDATDSVKEITIDLSTYSATAAAAQPLADRYLRRRWNGRQTVTNALSLRHLALEPGDVRPLNLDGIVRRAVLEKLTLQRSTLACEWRLDPLGVAALGSGTGSNMDGRDNDTLYVAGPSKTIIADVPLPVDGQASINPLIYYAVGGYGAGGFPGAQIFEADLDLNDYSLWNTVDPGSIATWGVARTALASCDPWLWDRGNTLVIEPFGGTLTSCTEADIAADPSKNLALLGTEWLNFTTATLQTDGTYLLSGLLRGRRGTEGSVGGHFAGETFVLAASLAHDGVGLSTVGQELDFKGATIGRDVTLAPVVALKPFAGATLKPYAPARVLAAFDGSDWTFAVSPRTRIGGDWTAGGSFPMVEASESFQIDVLDVTGAVKRTLSFAGTRTVTYTAAQQASDFGSVRTVKPALAAYQISATVGRGFKLAA